MDCFTTPLAPAMYNFEMTELERLLKQVVEPKSNAFLAFA
jgi:hypothetical protein